MYQSEDYYVYELHQRGEERLMRELELRRVIAERAAEEAELQVTDVARPPFLVRWRQRLSGAAHSLTNVSPGGGPTPITS